MAYSYILNLIAVIVFLSIFALPTKKIHSIFAPPTEKSFPRLCKERNLDELLRAVGHQIRLWFGVMYCGVLISL